MELKLTRLEQLPAEVFTHIVSYIGHARTIASISRVSKVLHAQVEAHGWHGFVLQSFPSFSFPEAVHPPWRDVARSLLTTARNLDRRAMQASFIEPFGDVKQLKSVVHTEDGQPPDAPERQSRNYPDSRLFRTTPGQSPARSNSPDHLDPRPDIVIPKPTSKWRTPRGQTMGFTPVIDSYDTVSSSRLIDRKEVLAYSAGSELLLRLRQKSSSRDDSGLPHSAPHYSSKWITYRPSGANEGTDDIAFVKLLSHESIRAAHEEHVLIGTAAGSLQHVAIRTSHSKKPYNVVRTVFHTRGKSLQAACVSPSDTSTSANLMATILDNLSLCLYPLESTVDTSRTAIHTIQPVSETILAKEGTRAWRTSFLNQSLLAVSLGPLSHPLHVYQVRPDGLSEGPVSKFSVLDRFQDGHVTPKSVYPVGPLWDGDGRVFASGGYDGFVRIHDTRSSRQVQYHLDGLEDGPIYSLLPRPNSHILAGAARHNVCKVFDLRAGREFLRLHSSGDNISHDTTSTHGSSGRSIGESLQLGSESPHRCPQDRNARGHSSASAFPTKVPYNLYIPRRATRTEGPVYSLSSPSPFSPFIYMGVENNIVEMHLDSLSDRHRDPVVAMTVRGAHADETRAAKKQNRKPANVAWKQLDLKACALNGGMISQGSYPPKTSKNVHRPGHDGSERQGWTTGSRKSVVGGDGLDQRWMVH